VTLSEVKPLNTHIQQKKIWRHPCGRHEGIWGCEGLAPLIL